MQKHETAQVTVFVSTHDRYRIAWKPFCHAMQKYWPDCPWPTRFLTNGLESPCGTALKVGEDTNWTEMQRRGLGQIQTDIILFMCEDYWLTETVDTGVLIELADIIVSGEADRILLRRGSHTSKGTFRPDPRLNIFADYSVYRTALQAGLWRVSTFLSLLEDGESAWDFEIKGSIRSQDIPAIFLNVKGPDYIHIVPPKGAIKLGKWIEAAKKYVAREGLQIDFSTNPDGTICG